MVFTLNLKFKINLNHIFISVTSVLMLDIKNYFLEYDDRIHSVLKEISIKNISNWKKIFY